MSRPYLLSTHDRYYRRPPSHLPEHDDNKGGSDVDSESNKDDVGKDDDVEKDTGAAHAGADDEKKEIRPKLGSFSSADQIKNLKTLMTAADMQWETTDIGAFEHNLRRYAAKLLA